MLKKERTTQPHKWYPFVEMGQVEKNHKWYQKHLKMLYIKRKLHLLGKNQKPQMVTQPQKGKKELCNRTHKSKRKRQRKNEKEILEILERVYTASQKAHQEHKDEVKRIEANYKGEARLNALTETNNAYYETLRSNGEKALNEINSILDRVLDNYK